MTIPTNPFVYIPNTLAQSAQVNASFNSIYAWANGGIDDTNLNHLVGIYASSITATTAAQGKFGTNPASTVGFQFIAPAANLTPLTISGVGGQSVDIFDVTLTSGGTKVGFFDSIGQFNLQSGATTSTPLLITAAASSQTGDWIHVTNHTGTNVLELFATSILFLGAEAVRQSNPVLQFSNDAASQNYTLLGAMGNAVNTISGTIFQVNGDSDLNTNNGTALITIDASGDLGMLGALHQTSLRANKKNIAPLSFSPLEIVTATDWKQYQLLGDDEEKQPHVGFMADESSEWLAGKTKNYMVPSDLAAIAAASVKELTLKLRAAGIAV